MLLLWPLDKKINKIIDLEIAKNWKFILLSEKQSKNFSLKRGIRAHPDYKNRVAASAGRLPGAARRS